jgi:hypothetical protein
MSKVSDAFLESLDVFFIVIRGSERDREIRTASLFTGRSI